MIKINGKLSLAEGKKYFHTLLKTFTKSSIRKIYRIFWKPIIYDKLLLQQFFKIKA